MDIMQHLEKLGYKAIDKVTGMEGVIVSVGFDLYGCVQAILHPGMDKDGKFREQCWFDIQRLEIISSCPVMHQPSFTVEKGPAHKPSMHSS